MTADRLVQVRVTFADGKRVLVTMPRSEVASQRTFWVERKLPDGTWNVLVEIDRISPRGRFYFKEPTLDVVTGRVA